MKTIYKKGNQRDSLIKAGESRETARRLGCSFSRASRANFAASPLVRPPRQNRHPTQAISGTVCGWHVWILLRIPAARILWDFNFLRRLAPGCLDGFSIGRYEEKRESFYPFATGFESGAMRFWGKKLLRHWSSFRTWIPPFHPCPSIIRNGQRAFTPGRRAQNASSEWNGQKSNIIVNLWQMYATG